MMSSQDIFINSTEQLSLVTDTGRKFVGLEHTKSPELAQRVKDMFHFLNGRLGFPNSEVGKKNQEVFNLLIGMIYPEILIDLADILYVQHERPAVFLNFDHIHINLRKSQTIFSEPMENMDEKFAHLFREIAIYIKEDPSLYNEYEWINILSEGYSFYLSETKNFPWDNPMEVVPADLKSSLIDVATGLAGFRLIHDWPSDFPQLVLADNMPFILQGLSHFVKLSGKPNVRVLDINFPNGPSGEHYGCILANKFLHHLPRDERKQFLSWAAKVLEPEGSLLILDTDLEYQILKRACDPEYRKKLTYGYVQTLVKIEEKFCESLI